MNPSLPPAVSAPNPLYCLSAFRIAKTAASILPRAIGRRLGASVARIVYGASPAVQKALWANLRAATGLDGVELSRVCRRNIAHFGEMLADYFCCMTGHPQDAERLLAKWSGVEIIRSALHEGRGVILVTGHLGHWELGAVLLALQGFPVNIVTAEEPSGALTNWRGEYRRKVGIRTIPVGGGHEMSGLEMMAALKRNEVVAMLVDRPYPGTESPVQLFDRPTEFSKAPALLWRHTGAAVVPAFVLASGDGYSAMADQPITFFQGEDRHGEIAANTQRLATYFEGRIAAHPEQWFQYVPLFG